MLSIQLCNFLALCVFKHVISSFCSSIFLPIKWGNNSCLTIRVYGEKKCVKHSLEYLANSKQVFTRVSSKQQASTLSALVTLVMMGEMKKPSWTACLQRTLNFCQASTHGSTIHDTEVRKRDEIIRISIMLRIY